MSLPVTDQTLSGSARVGPEGPEFWVQPCGQSMEGTGGTPPVPDSVLAEHYQMYLSQDLLYLEQWKEDFVSFTKKLGIFVFANIKKFHVYLVWGQVPNVFRQQSEK